MGGWGRRLLFRPHPGAVAAAPLVALPPSPQPSPSRERGPDFRPHPGALPRGRGGRTSALTPALSLAGEGAGAGWPPGVCGGWMCGGRLAPPVLFRPHPSPSPSRERGPEAGWLPGVCGWAAVPPVALPPSPQPSPSRARGWDFRPHPGAVPRGRGGRRRLGCRGFVGEGWMVGGCAAGCSSALTPALSLAGEGVRGGGAACAAGALPPLTPALSLAGEGSLVVGGCAAVALPPSPQPSPSRARGPDFRPSPRRCPSRERE